MNSSGWSNKNTKKLHFLNCFLVLPSSTELNTSVDRQLNRFHLQYNILTISYFNGNIALLEERPQITLSIFKGKKL